MRLPSGPFLRRILLSATVATAACGASSPPTEPSGPPVATSTITITGAGANPRNVVINVGERVRFINNDNRNHNMTSDPHPDHSDCPDVNQVGILTPGQSRETANLVFARVCGFHDHDLPDSTALKGTITIR